MPDGTWIFKVQSSSFCSVCWEKKRRAKHLGRLISESPVWIPAASRCVVRGRRAGRMASLRRMIPMGSSTGPVWHACDASHLASVTCLYMLALPRIYPITVTVSLIVLSESSDWAYPCYILVFHNPKTVA